MMKLNSVTCIGFVLSLSLPFVVLQVNGGGQSISQEKIIGDSTIIVPGRGSNGIVIGEDIDDVVMRFGKSKFKISRPNQVSELFKDVFKMRGNTRIYFDAMYYNEEKKCAVCVFKGRVDAVIGFDGSYTTSDAVNLQRGINNFIFNYGNRNLKLLRQGGNAIYVYPEHGIAVIDDGDNDTIDLYIVFSPSEKK
jgi:hypothetical protein